MKKRILALLLAFGMMLSLLPVSALADTGGGIGSAGYTSNGLIGGMPDLVMDNDTGRPKLSGIPQDPEGVYQGDGWRYVPQDSARNDKDTLYLDGASFNLSGASIWCNVVVSPRTTVENASFNYRDNPSGFPSVTNNGILQSCMFIECNITNNSTIQKSTIEDCIITNNATIRDSLFSINSSATLPFKFEKSGSITDSVFDFNPTTYGLTLNVHSLQASPIKALDISTASNLITYLYLRSNVFYTIGYPKIKVYCYNPDNPTDGSYNVRYINGVPAKSYDPDFKYADHCYIFTVQDNDVVLSSSEPTMPTLEMDYNGWPKTDGITPNNGVYYGDGWKYENSTLTLESGNYDFSYTYPKNSTGTRHSNHVKCNVVVNKGAAITGGILDGDSLTNSGTVKDILFAGYWLTNNNGTLSCLLGSSVYDDPSFTRHTMTAVDGSQIYYTVNQQSTGNGKQLYFTGTPKFTVKLEKSDIRCINGDKNYGGLTGPDTYGHYTFTPEQEEDIVLNQEHYVTDLAISNGIPVTTGREPIYGAGNDIIGCKGNGWTYNGNSDTLTLESGEYNFSNSKDGLGQLDPDVKLVVTGATLKGGAFNQIPEGLTADNVQPIILNGSGLNGSGSIEAVNGLSSPKWSKKLYAIKGSQVEIKASVPLTDINCRAIKSRYYLDNNDKTALRFTTSDSFLETYGGPELILNKSSRTNLIMKEDGSPDLEGIPYDRSFNEYIYTGDGWRYVDGISDYLELTAHSYNFRHCDPLNNKISSELAAVTCDITNSSGATIEDGIFKNFVENYGGTIKGGTFAAGLLVRYATEQGTVTGGAFNGNTALSDKAHPVTVHDGHIRKVNDTEPRVLDSSFHLTTGTEWNLYSYEGTIVTVTADTDITNINGWNIGRFRGSSYPNGEDDKKTVSFQMPDGPVVLNDTLYTLDIIRGTMWGNTSVAVPAGTELPLVADEPKENETFLGWTLSDESLLKDGTLNDPDCKTITITMKNASATAEAVFQKDTPAYTLTVTGGGLVNGKTSAVVEAGDEVCLTTGEMQEGMSFNYWDLPTALIKALMDKDSTFSNKVESLTFTMPDLSEYTEDTRFTIRLDIRPAELPDDDDGPSVLGTMATVAVGGAAAGILVWQGVSLGVDSYLQLSLPGGVPVPANRIELVKLLWETAGKPDVVLPALYGDVSAEDGELQRATRWAIDNGLVKPADDSDASRFDPDRSVSKYEVARAWFKVQQMLK